MAKINFPASSPYFTTTQTSWFTNAINLRSVPADANDVFIESLDKRYENRPDLLSYDYYGTPAYWWVFMARNIDVIRDPIWDMIAGISIYVPSKQIIESAIG